MSKRRMAITASLRPVFCSFSSLGHNATSEKGLWSRRFNDGGPLTLFPTKIHNGAPNSGCPRRGYGAKDVITQQLGDVTIDSILDLEMLLAAPVDFYEDVTPEAVSAERHWLEPKALDPKTGKIVLPIQSYLVRTRHHTILIDTCVGCRKSDDQFPELHNRHDEAWLHNLRVAGVEPGEIDFVFCTHLHLDHCGWNTQLVDGRWVSTFPNANM